MRRLTALVLALFLTLAVAMPAGASGSSERRTFVSVLSGRSEVPAVQTDGFGLSVLRLNRAETELGFVLITANLEDITMAHIHCGPKGANGPIVAFLFGPADPPVTKDGILSHGSISDDEVVDRIGGVCPTDVTDLASLITLIRDGNAYVNVHTTAFPGGEIRGQIK